MSKELQLTNAALLLVDIQEDFLAAKGGLGQIGLRVIGSEERKVVLDHCAQLIAAARKSDKPVIFVQSAFRPDLSDCFFPPKWLSQLRRGSPILVEGTAGASIPNEITPQAGDYVITKKALSAFQFTHLDRLLAGLRVDTCILAGFCGVSGSIDDTTRMGGLLGYDAVVAADAVYPLHSPHLDTFGKRAAVHETAEIVSLLQRPAPRQRDTNRICPALIIVAMNNDGHHPQGSKNRYKIQVSGAAGATAAERELFIHNNNRLIEAMTAKRFPVIHSQTAVRLDGSDDAHSEQAARVNEPEWKRKFPPGVGYMIEDTWGAEILEGVKLPNGYYRVYKKGNSAFGLTHMQRLLKNLGVNLCIITGDSTTGCISDTTREGAGLGYDLIVVSDATSRANIPYHQVLANRAEVKSTDEVIAFLEKLQPAATLAGAA